MAQKLKFGNGVWANKEGSTLAYNDENGNYKPLPFNFTRSSSATRVNKQGLIEVVKNNKPRIDYKDSAKGALILEPSRTNYITYSDDLSVAAWEKLSSTVVPNNVISPDGSQNADLINYSITSSSGYIRTNHTLSQYISIYVKYKDIQWIMCYGGGLNAGKYIDVKNGIIGNNVGSGANAEIYDVGNDWKRIIFYSSSVNINKFSIYAASSNGSYSSITLSGSIYLWGAQAEAGSYATSYIPTQGAAVTRVAETASGSGNSEVFNDSEGVLFANIASLIDDNDGSKSISLSNGGYVNTLIIQYTTTLNQIVFKTGPTYVTPIFKSFNLSDITLSAKFAFKYKLNDCSFWYNGFKLDSVTTFTPFANGTLNKLSFDRGDGGEDFEGKTKEIGYYDILTDAELEYLTSYRSWESMVNELNLNIIYNG